jgi:hypothetical protein
MERNEIIASVLLEEIEKLEQDLIELKRNISIFNLNYRNLMYILFRIFDLMD